ncbi:MAG: 4Fe-4S binding protein [Desulfobulbus sp.]|nr:4Fe-4S binding protein [Desulfobulbus sp.]
MRLTSLRFLVQHLGFIVLMYGGRFGVNLGPALPCFACPYVVGCGGHCYLMGLQGYIGFGLSWTALSGFDGWRVLIWFLIFAGSVVLLGKAWCGWLCPFGLVHDWLSALRRRLGWREALIAASTMVRLGWIKYGLLAYLILVPPLVTVGWLHPDFKLPFCNICPAKPLLPLLAGQPQYLSLDCTNAVTLGFTALSLLIAGGMLVGMFLKDRFFCLFCPLLALIRLLKPLTALRLVKTPQLCHGCGTCRRVCPMDIEEVYQEQEQTDVQAGTCLNCGRCLESCPVDGALHFNWFGRRLFSSSRRLALRLVGKKL